MFEKEADKYVKAFTDRSHIWSNDKLMQLQLREAYKDGAEFGYNKAKEEMQEQGLALQSDMDKTIEQNIALKKELNKANEWHFVKSGDLPNTEFGRVDVTVAYINAYDNPCKMDCCFDGTNFIYWDARKPIGWKKADIFGKIYAWKYQERLPELPKESE